MATVATRHMNEWERPQRRHYGHSRSHTAQFAHDFEERQLDASVLEAIQRRHYDEPYTGRNPVLDGTVLEPPPRPHSGRRAYGAGGLAHSLEFLNAQEGQAGVSLGGGPIRSCDARTTHTIRRMAVNKPHDHDLLLEHDELTSKNLSVYPEPLLALHNSSNKVPEKRRSDLHHKIQVRHGGASHNFFQMPADKRRTLVASQQRNKSSDPNIVNFRSEVDEQVSKSLKEVGPNVMRRRKFNHVHDFTKRADLTPAKDPQRAHSQHDVPKASMTERKKQLQDIMASSHNSLGNQPAGVQSDHYQEVDFPTRRALSAQTSAAGDIFRATWNFLKHEVPMAQHSQQSRSVDLNSSLNQTTSRNENGLSPASANSSRQLTEEEREELEQKLIQDQKMRAQQLLQQARDSPRGSPFLSRSQQLVRPCTAPIAAGRPVLQTPAFPESRQDRIRRFNGTNINILTGEVNPHNLNRLKQ